MATVEVQAQNAKVLPTFFAPAERADSDKISGDADFFLKHPYLKKIADSLPNALLILNKQRQIVFANESLAKIVGLDKAADALSLRAGEVLKCVHAREMEGGGCGTTPSCKYCGAVKAILCGIEGKDDIQECRICREDGSVLDLRVFVTPFETNNDKFVIFSLNDICHEKRRQALERIFFHDILNTAGSIQGLSEIVETSKPQELDELIDLIKGASSTLIDEIEAQKTLMAAENSSLTANYQPAESLQVIKSAIMIYVKNASFSGKQVVVSPSARNVGFPTDITLLRRVVSNLVKNALEASTSGQTVTVSCSETRDDVVLTVHNPSHMSEAVRLQVFQRSFSTKGSGRGLGTYSIKLLTEKYLGGSVSFTTSPEEGTTFTAKYPLRP